MLKRKLEDPEDSAPKRLDLTEPESFDAGVVAVLLPYLKGPTVIALAKVDRTCYAVIKKNIVSYCEQLCFHEGLLHKSYDHRRCLYQAYDLYCHGFLDPQDYDRIKETFGYSNDSLANISGTGFIRKPRRAEFLQRWPRPFTMAKGDFFQTYSFSQNFLKDNINLDAFYDTDDVQFISIAMLKSVMGWIIGTNIRFNHTSLVASRIPIEVLEFLYENKKIAWMHHNVVGDAKYASALLRFYHSRRDCHVLMKYCFDWKSKSLESSIPDLRLLVSKKTALHDFICKYEGGLTDQQFLGVLDYCTQKPFEFRVKQTIETEILLDKHGFLRIEHWAQYFNTTLPTTRPPNLAAVYLLTARKLHEVVKCVVRHSYKVAEDTIHLVQSLCFDPRSVINLYSPDVRYFLQRVLKDFEADAARHWIGELYFPGPAPPELLIYDRSGEKKCACYDYLWLLNKNPDPLPSLE